MTGMKVCIRRDDAQSIPWAPPRQGLEISHKFVVGDGGLRSTTQRMVRYSSSRPSNEQSTQTRCSVPVHWVLFKIMLCRCIQRFDYVGTTHGGQDCKRDEGGAVVQRVAVRFARRGHLPPARPCILYRLRIR